MNRSIGVVYVAFKTISNSIVYLLFPQQRPY